jgi:integrase
MCHPGWMKSGVARDIPLSGAALELLTSIQRDDTGFIFPGRKGKTVGGEFIAFSGALYKDAMQILLREELSMPIHVHGLRACFRSSVSAHAQSAITTRQRSP